MHSLQRSRPWDLRDRHIFITGGTGFIGRSILDYLIESAEKSEGIFQVTVLSRHPKTFLEHHPCYESKPWLKFVQGDLIDLPSNGNGYTDVIHAAADTHSCGSPLEWIDQIVSGTRNTLEFARRHGVKRFLFLSSGAVYGDQPTNIASLEEDMALAPLTTNTNAVYAHAKRMAEHLCVLYTAQYNIECVIARCFAVISKHMPLSGPYAAGNFLRDAIQSREIRIQSNGQAVRTYIDGRDAAHWLITILRMGNAGETYNVGSDQAISILGLAELIRTRVSNGTVITISNNSPSNSRSIYIPSIAKVRKLHLSIETTVADAIDLAYIGLQETASEN